MKTIISILALTLFTQISFAQDTQKEDIIKKAANEMAWGLYSANGNQQLLADQVERQIKEKIADRPEDSKKSDKEIIKRMIKKKQKENIEHASIAKQNLTRLTTCQEAVGEEVTEAGIYVERYTSNKLDEIQKGLAGKVKQYTAETYVQASLIGSMIEHTLNYGTCMEKLKALVKQAKNVKVCTGEDSFEESSQPNTESVVKE